ncbi:hypothetical protein G6F60_014513 [Rhizopus arrhizus]|nr:hypothetical protein G6F60_014513 [Rhizopus arrhizus]
MGIAPGTPPHAPGRVARRLARHAPAADPAAGRHAVSRQHRHPVALRLPPPGAPGAVSRHGAWRPAA